MTQRSSTNTKLLAVVLFLTVFAQRDAGIGVCEADGGSRTWPVGDSAGWTFGVMGWPNYKPFQAGDVLLFHYKPSMHNVVQVGSVQYALCQLFGNATVWNSGDDRVTLAPGMSFFLSCMPGDCERGMKIAVTAR